MVLNFSNSLLEWAKVPEAPQLYADDKQFSIVIGFVNEYVLQV
jgi:hypothetical protein